MHPESGILSMSLAGRKSWMQFMKLGARFMLRSAAAFFFLVGRSNWTDCGIFCDSFGMVRTPTKSGPIVVANITWYSWSRIPS